VYVIAKAMPEKIGLIPITNRAMANNHVL